MNDVIVKTVSFEAKELQVRKDLPVLGFAAVVARRNSGKTSWIKNVLARMSQKIDLLVVVGGSRGACESLGIHTNEFFVMEGWQENKVSQMLKSQQLRILKKDWVPTMLFVFDDLAFSSEFTHSKVLRELAFNGRHANCGVILSSQRLRSIPPNLRANFTSLTLFQTVDKEEVEAYFHLVSGLNRPHFVGMLKLATENYGALTVLLDTGVGMESMRVSRFAYRPHLEFLCLSERIQRACEKQLKGSSDFRREKIAKLAKEVELGQDGENGKGKKKKIVEAYTLKLLR